MHVFLFRDREFCFGYQFKAIGEEKCRLLQLVCDLVEPPCSRGILESAVRSCGKVGTKVL